MTVNQPPSEHGSPSWCFHERTAGYLADLAASHARTSGSCALHSQQERRHH